MKIPQIKGRDFNLPVYMKTYSFESKDVSFDEETKKVSGYLAVYGNKDDDGDILMKGCAAKSIRDRGPQSSTNRKIAFLYQHDMKDPIGQFKTLREDDYGLYFEAVLDEGVASADRSAIQLKSGTLNQFSIGFMYVWDSCEYDSNAEALIVKEINLFEGSVVTMGANEYTYFAGMKSAQKAAKGEEIQKETELFIKSLPVHNQYEARQILAKNISFTSVKKADTSEDDNDGDEDMIEKCLKDAMGNLRQGMDICDSYVESVDNSDLVKSLQNMKESHKSHLKKMKAHAEILGGKSLKLDQAGNPPAQEEPKTLGIFINNLKFVE